MATKKKSPDGDSGGSDATATQPSELYQRALREYGEALELLHGKEYAKAREAFRAVEVSYPDEPELADRSRTYARICDRRLEPEPEEPTSSEERFQMGVFHANRGDLDRAKRLLDGAIEAEPDSPKFFYARASVLALQGNAERAVADLRKAAELRPDIRFQAANDPDFERIRDDADFIDVIEPSSADR